MLTAGTIYLWFLYRACRVAATAACEPEHATSVIVFGKRLRNGRPDREFRWRLRHALRVLRRQRQLTVLLAGGASGTADEPSEAQAARQWLLVRAPDVTDRLVIEERSRDTVDNLREARKLLPAGAIALLSNRYHLARCELLARSLGIEAQACAAEPVFRLDRRMAGRLVLEAGYCMLFVVGSRWARWIGHARMISRVS